MALTSPFCEMEGLYEPWKSNAYFTALLDRIRGHTIVGVLRLWVLFQLALWRHSLGPQMAWSAAEIGVYKGGVSYLLGDIYRPHPMFAFDTFSGIPHSDPARDYHMVAAYNDVSESSVREFLSPLSNIQVVPGIFPASAEEYGSFQFSFVHLDVDVYRSTYESLMWLFPRMARPGIIVCDDYGFPTCRGAREAVDDFTRQFGTMPVYLPTGQAVMILNASH